MLIVLLRVFFPSPPRLLLSPDRQDCLPPVRSASGTAGGLVKM